MGALTGERIFWEYVVRLNNLQNEHGLQFANKLYVAHIQFHKAKMKVKLAAQVFSRSMVDALAFFHHVKTHGFQDCMATVAFSQQVCVFWAVDYVRRWKNRHTELPSHDIESQWTAINLDLNSC